MACLLVHQASIPTFRTGTLAPWLSGMFYSATNFNQNLCPWGPKLPSNFNYTTYAITCFTTLVAPTRTVPQDLQDPGVLLHALEWPFLFVQCRKSCAIFIKKVLLFLWSTWRTWSNISNPLKGLFSYCCCVSWRYLFLDIVLKV
jgi:hypothetical protein